MVGLGQAIENGPETLGDAQFSAMFHQSAAGMALTDSTGAFTAVNNRYCEIVARPENELLSLRMQDITHPDDLPHNLPEFQRVVENGGEFSIDKRYMRPDGSSVWVRNSVTGLIVGGDLIGALAVSVDISERMDFEEQLTLINSELHHRIKNTLAIVRALASQTFRSGRPVPICLQTYDRRLTALSAVHDLLLRDRSDHAQLKELVEGALDPFGLDRCNLSGCEIIIPPKLALNLAMVFHELATNAEKYGALSSPSGSVEIDWCLEPPHDLAIVWKERGGPLVIRPKRKGFGSRLLSRALKGSLNGSIEIDYDPQGIECRIRAALPETR